MSRAEFGMPWRVVEQPDGAVLLFGLDFTRHPNIGTIARIGVGGVIDRTFGVNGRVETPVVVGDGNNNDGAYFVMQNGDVVVGSFDDVVRVRSDGTVDPSFADEGHLRVRTIVSSMFAAEDRVQVEGYTSDGKALFVKVSKDAHTTSAPDRRELLLLRIDGAGTVDGTYGTRGVATTEIFGSPATTHVAADGKGRVLVAGTRVGIHREEVDTLTRLDEKGKVDATFGVSGHIAFDFQGHVNCTMRTRDKIVIKSDQGAVMTLVTPQKTAILVDISPAGAATYPTRHVVAAAPNPELGGFDLEPTGMQTFAQPLGTDSQYYGFQLVRYKPDGTRDASFETGGAGFVANTPSPFSTLIDVTATHDGKLVTVLIGSPESYLVRTL